MENSPRNKKAFRIPYHIASSRAIKESVVRRKSKLGRWKKKILVLISTALLYYDKKISDDSLEQRSILLKNIDLNQIKDPVQVSGRDQWAFTWVTIESGERQPTIYCTRVATQELAMDWVRLIREAIQSHKSYYRADPFKETAAVSNVMIRDQYYALQAAQMDQYNLVKLIESMTELDEFVDLKTSIRFLVEQKHHTDFISILEHCQRPCDMLYIDQSVKIDPSLDPRLYQNIEILVDQLKEWEQRLQKADEDIAAAVRKLRAFYENSVNQFIAVGYEQARIPPASLVIGAHFSTSRIIRQEVLKEIESGKRQKHGISRVTYYNGIYWKRYPTEPATEFAVYLISKMMTFQGCSSSVLLKVKSYSADTLEPRSTIFQASMGVRGILVSEMLELRPEMICRIDKTNYAFMYVMSLLMSPQDAKGENIVASEDPQQVVTLTGIDNDHAFADVVCVRNGLHFLNLKSVLFCLPQADEMFDEQARKHVLSLSPITTTISWLTGLHDQNEYYYRILEQGLFTKEDFASMRLPIRLQRGTAARVYLTLTAIQAILRHNVDVTPNQIFRKIYPVPYHYYAHALKTYGPTCKNLNRLFVDYIFNGPYLESIPELMSQAIPAYHSRADFGRRLNYYLSSAEDDVVDERNRVTVADVLRLYSRSSENYLIRERIPFEELEDLLTVLNFDGVSEEVDSMAVRCLCNFSYVNFTLSGSKTFKGSDLNAILSRSPALLRLRLNNCPNITSEDLKVIFLSRRQPEVFLSNMNIPASSLQEMVRHGLRLSTDDFQLAPSSHSSPPRSFQYAPPPHVKAMIQGVENLRAGKYHPALAFFKRAESARPGIVNAYSAQINALLSGDSARQFVRARPPAEFLKLLVELASWNVESLGSSGESPWHVAIRDGDVANCKAYLDLGVNVNLATSFDWRTPLHIAVLEGHLQIVDLLLNQPSCNVDALDRDNNTPLSLALLSYYADKQIQTSMALKLIEYGANIHLKYDSQQNTLLHIAITGFMGHIAKILVHKGAKINEPNLKGESPLHLACLYRCPLDNKTYLANFLLDMNADISVQTEQLCTVFHYAVRGGSKTILTSLIDKGFEIMQLRSAQKYNLLHEASCQRQWVAKNLLPILLSHLSDQINDLTSHHKTPLMIAAQAGNTDAIELLISANAQLDIADDTQDTALMWCVSDGNLRGVQLLIQGGANPNIFNENGISAMWRSVFLLYKSAPHTRATHPGQGTRPASGPPHPTYAPHSRAPLSSQLHEIGGELYSKPYFDIATFLLQNGGILDLPNPQGDYVIHLLARRILRDPISCTGIAELQFLARHKIPLLQLDQSGKTFLQILCTKKFVGPEQESATDSIIRLFDLFFILIHPQTPSSVIYQEDKKSKTALHYAIKNQCYEYLKRLAKEGGFSQYLDSKKKKRAEYNPLYSAICKCQFESADIIFSALESQLNAKDIKMCLAKAKENNMLELASKLEAINPKAKLRSTSSARFKLLGR